MKIDGDRGIIFIYNLENLTKLFIQRISSEARIQIHVFDYTA
jgi:hypothetical protein